MTPDLAREFQDWLDRGAPFDDQGQDLVARQLDLFGGVEARMLREYDCSRAAGTAGSVATPSNPRHA